MMLRYNRPDSVWLTYIQTCSKASFNQDFYIFWWDSSVFLRSHVISRFQIKFSQPQAVRITLFFLRIWFEGPALAATFDFVFSVNWSGWGRLTGLLRWRHIISFRGHRPLRTNEQSALCLPQTKLALWVQREDLDEGHLSTRALSSWTISKISCISLFQI